MHRLFGLQDRRRGLKCSHGCVLVNTQSGVQNRMLFTTVEIPDRSPPYQVESPRPGLNTGFCDASTLFAFANFSRFFTLGLRTLFDLRGVNPRFLRIARVRERGPSALLSSNSTLHEHTQIRRCCGDIEHSDNAHCLSFGSLVRHLLALLLLSLLLLNKRVIPICILLCTLFVTVPNRFERCTCLRLWLGVVEVVPPLSTLPSMRLPLRTCLLLFSAFAVWNIVITPQSSSCTLPPCTSTLDFGRVEPQ